MRRTDQLKRTRNRRFDNEYSSYTNPPTLGDPLTIAILGALLAFFILGTVNAERSPERVAAVDRALKSALPSVQLSLPLKRATDRPSLSVDKSMQHLVSELPGTVVSVSPEGYPIAIIPENLLFDAEQTALSPSAGALARKLKKMMSEHSKNEREAIHFQFEFYPIRHELNDPKLVENLLQLTYGRAWNLQHAVSIKNLPSPQWKVHLSAHAERAVPSVELALIKQGVRKFEPEVSR